jgi:hypothetical protein
VPGTQTRTGRFTRAAAADPPPPQEPRVGTYTRRAWVALTIFALLQIALLGAQLYNTSVQKHIAQVQKDRLDRVVSAGGPEIDRLRADEPAVRAGLGRANTLVEDLNRTGAPKAIAAAGALAQDLAGEARLVTMVDRLNALTAALAKRGTLGSVDQLRRIASQLLDLTRRGYGTQRRLLSAQLQALAILKQSLAVQQETLQHARNLDNKTGGGGAAAPLPLDRQR